MSLLDSLNEQIKPLFPGLMGMKILEITPERVTGAMHVRPDLCTAGNTLHGGAIMAFADTLGAVATIANLPKGARTTTIESKTNFVGSAPQGCTVVGEATAFHRGRSTMVWQTQIRREDGKLVAVVSQTQMVLGP